MREIIIVQHCESEQHVNGMVGSWRDWPLTARGHAQADAIGAWLKKKLGPLEDTFTITSSDLQRTAQTAQHVGEHLGITPTYDSRLREQYFGEAIGHDMKWYYANMLPDDGTLGADYRMFPSAESKRELYARAEGFWQKYLETAPQRSIVVCHGGMTGALIFAFLQLGADHMAHAAIEGDAGGVSILHDNGSKRHVFAFGDLTACSQIP